MKNIMENLFYECKRKMRSTRRVKELEKCAENNSNRLKAHMTKKEKAILLRIIDAKNLIIEEESYCSFIHGFKTGLKIGYEVNR